MAKFVLVDCTSSVIWNKELLYADIVEGMLSDQDLFLCFNSEAPDLHRHGIYNFLETRAKQYNYSLSRVTVQTGNMVERHHCINVIQGPVCCLFDVQDPGYNFTVEKANTLKHFGIFINKSTGPRLHLASYLHKYHANKSYISYRFDIDDDFHTANIGLDELVKDFGLKDLSTHTQFLAQCPMLISGSTIQIDTTAEMNPAQQLLKSDQENFFKMYNNFFVEIAGETFYTGNAFKMSEKTMRAMLFKTPFIVHGAQNYLQNLKRLGFKTFDTWWDESYSLNTPDYGLHEVTKCIDYVSKFDQEKIQQTLTEMQPVLEHNYNTMKNITQDDFMETFYAK